MQVLQTLLKPFKINTHRETHHSWQKLANAVDKYFPDKSIDHNLAYFSETVQVVPTDKDLNCNSNFPLAFAFQLSPR